VTTDRPVVYIAHDMSGNWNSNVRRTRQWVRRAIEGGYAPLAPYLYLTDEILDSDDPTERDFRLEINLSLVTRCDELWLCGDRISSEMQSERDVAVFASISIRRFFSLSDVPTLGGFEIEDKPE
jgi:dienelactone hydrolase